MVCPFNSWGVGMSCSNRRSSRHSVIMPEFLCKDWSVCLLTLKHLVSLQTHVSPSVQAELDLCTSDRWEERDRKKENVIFVPLNVSLIRDTLQSFYFSNFTEVVCVYIHYRSVSVFVYSTIVYHILFMTATLLDVSVLLLFATLYTYRLNYFNVTIGK